MRHFRLRPSTWSDIGSRRASPSIGGASHSGLLPGTYALAWQVSSGSATFTVPLLVGKWDQTSPLPFGANSQTSCTLPTGIDVVAIFSQSADPKDADVSEYGKLSQFLGRAACEVTTWPNPLPVGGKVAAQ
jgi:hypothetical protein